MPFMKRNASSSSTGSANAWTSNSTSETKRDRALQRRAGTAQLYDPSMTPKASRAKADTISSSISSLSLQSNFSTAETVYRTSNSSLDDPFVDNSKPATKPAQRASIYANYPPASPLSSDHYDTLAGLRRPGGKSSRVSPYASTRAAVGAKPKGNKDGAGNGGAKDKQGRASKILGTLDFTYKNYYALVDAAPSAMGTGGSGRVRPAVPGKKPAGKLACW